jgi:CheY-like chemotaxis protein
MSKLARILMVEDEADICAIAKIALVELGEFVVKTCESGEEALACAADFSPDLMLIDVMLPGMNGLATLQGLRRLPALAETPAVFMTARIQPQEIEGLKDTGALGVISKPFDVLELPKMLTGYWNRYHEKKPV